MNIRPDGESVLVDGTAHTIDEARALARAITEAANAAHLVVQARERSEARAAIEAAHPGGRWLSDLWNGERYVWLGEDGPRQQCARDMAPRPAEWCDLPRVMPELWLRSKRRSVAHLWRGGPFTACGTWAGGMTLAPEAMPTCQRCARVTR